ncbi:helix-hairpin-helix domain-containing protein [Companilactobacillus insicii]|uniref:helix-hairpin-helix domain-containing protein n=1 Tax=Companilactobacillus insicii TaxID=1732567 RepID=UPI000F79DAE4|nr:helix-hairpin-helix domain-containing protein [Companilactobacillus insicii]
MNKIIDYIIDNKILVGLVIVIMGFSLYYASHTNKSATSTAGSVKVEQRTLTDSTKQPSESKKVSDSNKKEFAVDIQGAVKVPGVYRLKPNSIVQEAIGKAGGFIDGADTKSINQAQRVTDQMQIVVPKIGETQNVSVANGVSKDTNSNDKQVNINTATVEDFQKVSGIGPKKAEKIIDYRTQNGNFNNLEDLTKVSGIGDKTLDSLRDQLTI